MLEYLYYIGNAENGAYIFATDKDNRTGRRLEDFYRESYVCEDPVMNFTYFQGKVVSELVL